jgi:hypothetical protein
MRCLLSIAGLLAGLAAASAAHAERVCTAAAADPAITVALHLDDAGVTQAGEVHWAVPNVQPDLPSMVHIVYPLDGERAGDHPLAVITLNAVTGNDIARSPTASIQIVVDGMEMAVRAWDLYGQTVASLQANPPEGGVEKASFVGAVSFSPRYQDGRKDIDSDQALRRIGTGAHSMEVRLLGQDGLALQDHTYRLFDMGRPAKDDVQSALDRARALVSQPERCVAY